MTRWTLIVRAQAGDAEIRTHALDELLSLYYPVLRKFLVVGMGFNADAAGDLLQGFVAEKVLAKNLLEHARREKGRFRNFLFKALKHYALSELRKQQARKRAPAEATLGADELQNLPSHEDTLADTYSREWARQILAEVLHRMQRECEQKGRADIWGIFDARVVQPQLSGQPAIAYETLVACFGCESPTQAFNLVITAKRMFRRILVEVVRDTVESEDQAADEIRDLQRILAK